MKSFFVNLVVAACAVHEGGAFSTSSPSSIVGRRPSSLPAATVGQSSSANSRSNDQVAMPTRPPTAAEVREMETIRGELIEKYISLGHSEEVSNINSWLLLHFPLKQLLIHILCHFQLYLLKQYATREVGYFLEDSERSKQYVEMRRVAMARGNDLGIEDYIQFAAAFLVGMMGVPALNALHSLQVRDIIRMCCMLHVDSILQPGCQLTN